MASEKPSMVQTTTRNIILNPTSIPLSAATEIARRFLQSKNTTGTTIIKNAQTITKKGIPYFHIINANKGFVILSSDSLFRPILAYDSINNFSFADKDLNPGLILWLNKQAHKLDFIRNNKSISLDSTSAINKFLWRVLGGSIAKGKDKVPNSGNIINQTSRPNPLQLPPTLISSVPVYFMTNSTVGPLCTTNWNQNYPFNQNCPTGTGGVTTGNIYTGGPTYMPAGIDAVDLAQIMYFWKCPNSNTINYNNYPWLEYNWSSMVQDPTILSTNYSIDPGGYTESARLIAAIGSNTQDGSQFVNYSTTGSGTPQNFLPNNMGTLMYDFGYNSGVILGGYTSDHTSILNGPGNNSYYNIIINEVGTNNRPCLVSGFSAEYEDILVDFQYQAAGAEYAWICDGTDISTFYSGTTDTYEAYDGTITVITEYSAVGTTIGLHMNWSWGSNNGWYYDTYTGNDYTTAPDGNNYQYFQHIWYNIHP
jgi:hypothetical protein